MDEASSVVKKGDLKKLKELLHQGINVNAQDTDGRTLLHHATNKGHHEVMKCLLKNGADVLLTTEKNNTVLHIAVAKGKLDTVMVILQNVAREKMRKLLDAKTKTAGTAALHVAVERNFDGIAFVLMLYGANYEVKNNAGAKPVDVANEEGFRDTFKTIDESFALARSGDERLLTGIRELCESILSIGILNCRNKKGRTIMQVLVLNGNRKLLNGLLEYRWQQPLAGFFVLADPKNKRRVDRLTNIILECLEFWNQTKEAILALNCSVGEERRGSKCFTLVSVPPGKSAPCAKLACQALEKAHKVLLQYRKIEGRENTLTANVEMRTLEEVLEVLGYDPEELFVGGKETSYYRNLPIKYKNDVAALLNLMDNAILWPVVYLSRSIYTMQIFEAAKADDVDKVKDLLRNGGSVRFNDRDNRSALYYAVEMENKKMVRLLVESGSILNAKIMDDDPLGAELSFLLPKLNSGASPIYLAIQNGNAKILKIILKNVTPKQLPAVIDSRRECGSTALHEAARIGSLDIVKLLLRYGATYYIFNKKGYTPVDLATSEKVTDFLNLVDELFRDAKEADDNLVYKLKAMEKDEFMAVAGTKNSEGQTLAVVAAKAKAKNIAVIILRMIKEAKHK